MVWCGVVWFGVVWCGVVWCGVIWGSAELYGLTEYSKSFTRSDMWWFLFLKHLSSSFETLISNSLKN